jgi:hypothetical protein
MEYVGGACVSIVAIAVTVLIIAGIACLLKNLAIGWKNDFRDW